MAKKPMARDDELKKEYSDLVKLNQSLKNISEGYYISHNGEVYMKSLVPFIEKVIYLNDTICIPDFHGAMILPNEFFEFTKVAKKTKLGFNELLRDKIVFNQKYVTDKILEAEQKKYLKSCVTSYDKMSLEKFTEKYMEELETDPIVYTLNIVNSDSENDYLYIESSIKPNMYKRFFSFDTEDYIMYNDESFDELSFINLSEDDVVALATSNPLFVDYNDTTLTFTKQLFLDIKKDDYLGFTRYCYLPIEGDKKRVFYIIKHISKLYTDYTIFNALQ